MDTVTLLPLLSQSLSSDPQTRRGAERQLAQNEPLPGFLLSVLSIVRGAGEAPMEIRLAAGIYFKNAIKKTWVEEVTPLVPSLSDRQIIKEQLVPVMISLSTPQLNRLQAQVGEAVAAIAESDFPDQWEGLVAQLVSSISPDNFSINIGVLQTAHSIFKRWKSQFASDRLYSEILVVLNQFCVPYFELFKRTDELLSLPPSSLPPTATLPQLAQTLLLLLQLFHDLNAQDLPEFFEDNLGLFFGNPATGEIGLLGKYLRWEQPELEGDEDDTSPSPLDRIRSQICSILELFTMKYSDAFNSTLLAPFVQSVWEFLGGPVSRAESTKQDVLVCRALGFLGVVVKMGDKRSLFEQDGTLEAFLEKIVLPNMSLRTHEEETFEDDPMEYIRTDLEPSTESDTRRQAATDFTRALMEQFESQVTTIVKRYIDAYLQQYAQNPVGNWKSKDTAIYLLTSIASRGATVQHGVTSTNVLVDVVQFFSQNVFQDLQTADGNVFLLVDAIKFLHTFRNQLTKDQLVSVLPILIQHLSSSNYVVYTYAATTIERILFIRVNGQALFSQADVRPFAQNILTALFTNIERGVTPEKMAENDYLMRCVMRVILTARQSLTPVFVVVLQHLVGVIAEISKNPSNPKFNQYCFESVSALIRFVAESTPASVAQFEAELFGPIMAILQNDVVEFVPYVFQILSQLLELHPADSLPEAYQNLLGPLLTAALWEQRGNVPALVRMWKALLRRGASTVVANGQVQSLLGVFQKLISSNINDVHGFALLQALFECLPISALQPYIRTILVLLSTRLQSSKTPTFVYSFVYFFAFCFAIKKDDLSPDFMIAQYETVQPGIFGGILQGVVLPQVQKFSVKDRKVVSIGLARLLTGSETMVSEPLVKAWPTTMNSLLALLFLPQDLTSTGGPNPSAPGGEDDLGLIENDESGGGFQASFARLGSSEAKKENPVGWCTVDEKVYVKEELTRVSAAGGVIQSLLGSVNQEALARLSN